MLRMTLAGVSMLALGLGFGSSALADGPADKRAVLETYADIAHAMYEDSLITANALKLAVDGLAEAPSEEALAAARQA